MDTIQKLRDEIDRCEQALRNAQMALLNAATRIETPPSIAAPTFEVGKIYTRFGLLRVLGRDGQWYALHGETDGQWYALYVEAGGVNPVVRPDGWQLASRDDIYAYQAAIQNAPTVARALVLAARYIGEHGGEK